MTGDGEPVAWRVIEPGWSVLDAAGNEIGKVDRITGDLEADIFDGITVGDGGKVLTRARYVSSDHVAQIHRGEVRLDLSPEDVPSLEPYTEPVSQPLSDLLPRDEEEGGGGRRSGSSMLIRRLLGRRP
jgi:hypothetical protein